MCNEPVCKATYMIRKFPALQNPEKSFSESGTSIDLINGYVGAIHGIEIEILKQKRSILSSAVLEPEMILCSTGPSYC